MSTPPANFNYAHYAGIYSVGGAVVFLILYLPLLLWYLFRLFKLRTRVFIILSLFCAVRVASFTIRAILAGSESAGEDKGLLIGYTVLFSVGFSGVLYSAIELIFDRERLFEITLPSWIPPRIVQWRGKIVHLAMTASVALGVTASNMLYSSNPSTAKNGMTFREASTYIFLGLALLLLLSALWVAKSEIELGVRHRDGLLGYTHGGFFLVMIGAFLVTRMVFYAATIHHSSEQQNEHLWYPLVALPEFLATALFTPNGLVPPRDELKARKQAAESALSLKDDRASDQGYVYPPIRQVPV